MHEEKTPPCTGWTPDTLFLHFSELIKAHDRIYAVRFEAQEKALEEARSQKTLILMMVGIFVAIIVGAVEVYQRMGK